MESVKIDPKKKIIPDLHFLNNKKNDLSDQHRSGRTYIQSYILKISIRVFKSFDLL